MIVGRVRFRRRLKYGHAQSLSKLFPISMNDDVHTHTSLPSYSSFMFCNVKSIMDKTTFFEEFMRKSNFDLVCFTEI